MISLTGVSSTSNNYLIWSGGYDSSWLLLALADYSSVKNPLHVISYEVDCLEPKSMKKQKEARDKMRSMLKDEPILFHTINLEQKKYKDDYLYRKEGQSGLPQVTFWLGMVLPYINDNSSIVRMNLMKKVDHVVDAVHA